jgi:uncharacterized membrane protein (UPF0136 family)
MKIASVTCFLFGVLVGSAGIYALLQLGSVVAFVGSTLSAILLFVTGYLSLKGITGAGYASGVVTFLLAVYFAYRFIASERFFISGILLILSFVSLFFILLGVFMSLQDEE